MFWNTSPATSADLPRRTSAGLAILGNDARLAPGVDRNTAFVADWSGDPLNLGANALGPGLQVYERR